MPYKQRPIQDRPAVGTDNHRVTAHQLVRVGTSRDYVLSRNHKCCLRCSSAPQALRSEPNEERPHHVWLCGAAIIVSHRVKQLAASSTFRELAGALTDSTDFWTSFWIRNECRHGKAGRGHARRYNWRCENRPKGLGGRPEGTKEEGEPEEEI